MSNLKRDIDGIIGLLIARVKSPEYTTSVAGDKATQEIINLIESALPEEKKIDIEIPSTLHRNIGYNDAIRDIKSKLIRKE